MSPIEEVIVNKKSNINPIWIMRQAGRYLPEFREIRKQNPDFIKLCLNEKLSSEITLQPLKRFNLENKFCFFLQIVSLMYQSQIFYLLRIKQCLLLKYSFSISNLIFFYILNFYIQVSLFHSGLI